MNYKQLFFILALGFLIPSLIIPWVSIDFIGESTEYTPLKITKDILIKDNSNSALSPVKMIRPYKSSYYSMILSMMLYFSSFYFLYKSNSKKSNKLLLFAGIALLLAVGLYTFSIENYKTEFSYIASKTGGIIGEEFRGQENLIINSILQEGYGYKLAIIAAIFSILSYVKKDKDKEN